MPFIVATYVSASSTRTPLGPKSNLWLGYLGQEAETSLPLLRQCPKFSRFLILEASQMYLHL
jgi:hypothetical protein